MEAARAGIHRANKHHSCGKGHAAAHARDMYDARFERLSQRFKHAPAELRQFIEKQDARMRETDLSRTR
jgi:hypothetical protein